MQSTKSRNVLGAIILIALIVIYTVYRMNDTEAVSVTVGVDDNKIGIVESGETPLFINLDDVTDVELVDQYDASAEENCKIYADDKIGSFVVITTEDGVYVVNSSSKNATKTIYKDIVKAKNE